MKFQAITIALIVLFGLTACNNSNPNTQEVAEKEVTTTPKGVWQRQELYVDGELQSAETAVLNLNDDLSYSSSTSVCTSSGDYSLAGKQLILNMTTSDCPGVPVPLNVTYDYTIKIIDEKETMTLTTANVLSNYTR